MSLSISFHKVALSATTLLGAVAISACALVTQAPPINAAPVTGSSSLSSTLDLGTTTPISIDTVKLTQQAQNQAAPRVAASLVRVVDGDTIVVNYQGAQKTVRMIGIDSPETKHPTKPVGFYGPESSQNLTTMLRGATITLEFDSTQAREDQYGRLLAYVWYTKGDSGLKLANLEQIASGSAAEYSFDTRYNHRNIFLRAQTLAKASSLGMWG